jgi:NAD(P)-dependent dehydrogenase (short-subunit alcohol dehydrogenase family)
VRERLDGKVALITGAGSGMGREACAVFASEGARVTAVDIDPELLEGTEAAVGATDGHRLGPGRDRRDPRWAGSRPHGTS